VSSQDSFVIIDTKLWSGHPRNCGLLLPGTGSVSLQQNVQTGSICTESKAARV